ncbi:MAG: cytochrome b/b6 domain-containing protein [Sedimentisphaerales bacterium]|jgi:cytochrome b subunit of formate dehydrogenase
MFRSIAITGFIAVIAGTILHFAVSKPKFDDVFGKDRSLRILDPLRLVVFLKTLLFVEQKWSLVGVLRKLVFLLAILCFVVLVVTGFVPNIFLEKSITGWWLMIHATFAPIFAACLAALAVLWADKNRLDKNYWPWWLNRALLRQPGSTTPAEKYELGLKISFWTILVLSLPMILSAVLGTFALFGTDGQRVLLQIHRYSTLLLSLFAIIYLELAALTEMNRTASK